MTGDEGKKKEQTMIVVTYATDDQGWFRALEAGCLRHRLTLVVLGWGATWKNFLQKPRAVKDFLRQVSPTEMILVVDAFDVLILHGEEEFLRRYTMVLRTSKQSGPVIVGIDNLNGPRWVDWYLGAIFTHFPVLNAGVFFGPAADLRRLYSCLLLEPNIGGTTDDQKRLNAIANKMNGLITVDTLGLIIHTATVGRPPHFGATDSPCVVHAPVHSSHSLAALCT